MFLIAGQMRKEKGGRPLSLHLPHSQLWIGQMRAIGVPIARKKKGSELRGWLTKRVSQLCKHEGDPSSATRITEALLHARMEHVRHPSWISSVLGDFDTPAGDDSPLRRFVECFAAQFASLPVGTVLDEVLRNEAAFAIANVVPFFASLGRDFTVVSNEGCASRHGGS
jgi:hypothetical protein